ncbi:MAG TPA: hypothetical protein VGJ45_07165 [Pseudonocardiaceae bacterium]|jgi:hypothetical protein
MRRGQHFQTMPTRVEVMEHTGSESLSMMTDWVIDLHLSGLIPTQVSFNMMDDAGRPVGRLHLGPGADSLITQGGHLVFRPGRKPGPGVLEVVDAERFYREFQPLR